MEALKEGLLVTVLGLTIVFSVLIILWGVLELMRIVLHKPAKPAKPAKPDEPKAVPVSQPQAVPATETVVDEETVAVIMAAIASSMNTSTYHLNIKSIRRIPSVSPAWNSVSRKENIDNRF